MTNEEAIERLNIHKEHWEQLLKDHICEKREGIETIDALDMAIKALEQCEVWNGSHGQIVAPKGTFERIYNDCKDEQQPCEDCISREEAIDIIYDYEYKKDMRKALEDLPSVQPTRPKGKWIEVEDAYGMSWFRCDKCGDFEYVNSDYCPLCGADMRGEAE